MPVAKGLRPLRFLALACVCAAGAYAFFGPGALGWALLCAACLEGFFLVMYAVADGGLVPIRRKLWDENPNMYAADGKEATTLFDRFMPHPHLGHVNHDNPPAGRAPATGGMLRVNSEGFIGPEFPAARPEDEFVIMVSGGSVAERFAQDHHSPGGVVPPMLEALLNERYLPPDGKKRFRVLNGAVGGWKQPQQLAMLCLHAHLAHAFVTLEGYNETMASILGVAGRGLRFEYPWLNLYGVDRSPARKFALRAMRRVHAAMLEDLLLSRSRLAYWLSVRLRGALESWAERREREADAMPTTFDSLFAKPPGSDDDPLAWAAGRYACHLRSMGAVAREHGVRLAVFMQPCAAISKELTPEEKALCGRSGHEEAYRMMERAVLDQDGRGMNAASLLDVFSGVSESVYIDDAHFNPPRLDQYGRGLGHRLVAEAMAARLAGWWGLTPREGAREGA